jgi:flagellar basal body-associated protein FliL
MAEEVKKATAATPPGTPAEKADKKEPAKKAGAGGGGHGAAHGGGGGLMTKTPVLLGMVMIIEAVVLFAGFKFLGAGAKPAAGAELVTNDGSDSGSKTDGKDDSGDKGKSTMEKKKSVVMKVTEFKAPNKKNGITFLYDLKICIVTKAEYQKQIEDTIADKEPLIQDRIRTIIAQSDPEKLSGGAEPGLETLRRQVKYQLDEIIGDGMIDEVLVPRCIPFRTDY